MVKYRITEADYVASSLLYSQLTRRQLFKYVGVCLISFLIAAVLAQYGFTWVIAVVIGGVVGGSVGGEITRRVVVPLKARRIYKQQRALQEAFELSWNESGLSFSGVTGSGTTPWSHYHEVRHNSVVILFLLSDVMYHLVPKSAFQSSQESADFLAFAESRISG